MDMTEEDATSFELRSNLLALRKHNHFEQTDWDLIQHAGQRETPHWAEALDSLCRIYWYPLYSFLRQRGYTPEKAKDLTQGFFALLLEGNLLETACPEKGRFRSFLLGSLKKFVSNQHQRDAALKRGGEFQFVPLEMERDGGISDREPADDLTPEKVFARHWALTVLEEASARLKREYAQAGKEQEHDVLVGCLDGEKTAGGYKILAERLKMKEGAVRVAAHRLRIRYALMIRRVIAETVAGPDQVQDELRHLQSALQG
jgi:DNA-directed RNA polymerase specialized sigma24 family protein